jgi:hypothetical protein
MYVTLEWKGELVNLNVVNVHASGMMVVEAPEGGCFLCIPDVQPGQTDISQYTLKLLEDNPLLREPPDPFRSPEAQAYLNSWDGTERFMTITVLVPTKG